MKTEERVIVRLYPHAGSYCDGVCVVADGKSRRVDESGRANANAEHIRNAFAEAEADVREPMECGHPQACFTLGEPGPDIPFCSACKDVADERERCVLVLCKYADRAEQQGFQSEAGSAHTCVELLQQPPAESEPAEDNSPEVICDILGLADCVVPLTVVVAWTEQDRKLAGGWAAALIALASDNDDVTIPPEPLCVKGYTHASMTNREVRAALATAIDNADTPRPGSKAEAAIKKGRIDRRLTPEEWNRPIRENE